MAAYEYTVSRRPRARVMQNLSVDYEADSVRKFPRGGPGSCAQEPPSREMALYGACKMVYECGPPGGDSAFAAAAPLSMRSSRPYVRAFFFFFVVG